MLALAKDGKSNTWRPDRPLVLISHTSTNPLKPWHASASTPRHLDLWPDQMLGIGYPGRPKERKADIPPRSISSMTLGARKFGYYCGRDDI
jgi:hypothetical protein